MVIYSIESENDQVSPKHKRKYTFTKKKSLKKKRSKKSSFKSKKTKISKKIIWIYKHITASFIIISC